MIDKFRNDKIAMVKYIKKFNEEKDKKDAEETKKWFESLSPMRKKMILDEQKTNSTPTK
jgi:hypothetical protein